MTIDAVMKLSPNGGAGIALEVYDTSDNSDIFEGAPIQKGAVFLTTEDGKTTMGVWESTPYAEVVHGGNHDEFCQVISGKLELVDGTGSSKVFEAGDSYVVSKGFKGTFRVLETMRKYYVVYG